MSTPERISAFLSTAFWALAALSLIAVAWVGLKVDFEPRVGSDFFFSTDDPQLATSRVIAELFPSSPQLFVAAAQPEEEAVELAPEAERRELQELGRELAALEGVADVKSPWQGPAGPTAAREGPLWRRLVLSSDPRMAYFVVALEEEADEGELVSELEALLARYGAPDRDLHVAGVPFVVENVRRELLRDLRVFTLTALLVFGVAIALVYRSWRISLATLATCLAAAALTLAILDLLGIAIGLLTANIVTIVFVLTLSHAVFLTARWRRLASEGGERSAERAAREVFGASFWCMVTTLLGFSSLLFASARPLRELGLSGAIGAAVAIVAAYSLYPRVLAALPLPKRTPRDFEGFELAGKRQTGIALTLAAVAVLAAVGLPGLETDPPLPSYFGEGSAVRAGLERIDLADGTSPLQWVVRDPAGGVLIGKENLAKLDRLQEALEDDPAVGSALGLPVLLAQARQFPMAFLLSTEQLLEILESPVFDGVARNFLSPERDRAHFFLRMRETGRAEPRRAVVERLEAHVRAAGLEVELAGGLYDLQGRLGELVASSLAAGLGGLFALFLVVAFAVARSPGPALAMVASLTLVPVVVLGAFGLLGQPLDVISSPAANVAIALGIDSMIHLVTAMRRRRNAGDPAPRAWTAALAETGPAILGAAFILAAGFGIFGLSSFPPTQRFGLAVALGTLIAATTALVVLPRLATAGRNERSS